MYWLLVKGEKIYSKLNHRILKLKLCLDKLCGIKGTGIARVKKLPSSPDIVVIKYKIAIFHQELGKEGFNDAIN